MWQKILNNSLSIIMGVLIGSLIGFTVSTIAYKASIRSVKDAYDAGKTDAQKECVELIKNISK